MPNELENRLGRALRSIPLTGQSRERARQVALEALTPPPPSRRPVAVKVLVASIGAACLITAGVALAASGGVEFHVGRPAASTSQLPARPATASSPLPPGSASFIVEVGGRVWSAGAHSLRPIAGRLSTIAVSPGALYELQAKAHLLRAVASRSGRVAFTHRVRGRVTAASWSPFPIRIAFLEQTPSGYVMHDMWGTGSHDRRAPSLAAPVAPSWRWDSLAVAFVRANGRVAILSPTSGAVKTLPRVCSIRRAQAIAYSPSNGLLAIAGGRRVGIVDTTGSRPLHCIRRAAGTPSLAWLGGRRLAIGAGNRLRNLSVAWSGVRSSAGTVPGSITTLAPAPQGHGIAIAIDRPQGTSVLVATAEDLVRPRPLFTLQGVHGPAEIQWR